MNGCLLRQVSICTMAIWRTIKTNESRCWNVPINFELVNLYQNLAKDTNINPAEEKTLSRTSFLKLFLKERTVDEKARCCRLKPKNIISSFFDVNFPSTRSGARQLRPEIELELTSFFFFSSFLDFLNLVSLQTLSYLFLLRFGGTSGSFGCYSSTACLQTTNQKGSIRSDIGT